VPANCDCTADRTNAVSANAYSNCRGRMTRANLEHALMRDINPDINLEVSERLTSLNTTSNPPNAPP